MKNFVITGASRGIGLATVKELINTNNRVYAISRNTESLVALKELLGNSEQLICLNFDIVKDDLAQLDSYFKDTLIHGLINNAGVLLNKPFAEISQEELQRVYEVNVFGLIRITQYLLPNLMLAKGNVLNVSSMGGINGSAKFSGLSAYSSSKGAVSILTECLAEELKESGVHVNAVALGAVQTEMLNEAFPGYQASVQPQEMGKYLSQFVQHDYQFYNGKILQVSNSTP